MIVVDASVLVDILTDANVARLARSEWFPGGATIHAPHLIDIEVIQAIRRRSAIGELPPAHADDALGDLASFPMTRYPHTRLLPRVWELRSNMTAYDATYVALAEALDAKLLTRDGRLARAPGHRSRIELV